MQVTIFGNILTYMTIICPDRSDVRRTDCGTSLRCWCNLTLRPHSWGLSPPVRADSRVELS